MPPVTESSPYSELAHSRTALEITTHENERSPQSTALSCAQTFIKDLDKERDVTATTKFLNVRIKMLRN